ncbi:hypothetical protein [Primorskyibacter sp. S187A]|uniref:hypothetical protein n=1 Tax=Primorskyibacter sp. S187A TaxID=3415130 RepID=UPI003C7D8827
MNLKDLQELAHLAEAKLNHAQGRMAKITAREMATRRTLQDIDAGFQIAATTPPEELSTMMRMGAHQLWTEWSRRKKAQANQDLALILAEKGEYAQELRKHLGKRDALKDIAQSAQKQDRAKSEAKAQEALLLLQIAHPPKRSTSSAL